MLGALSVLPAVSAGAEPSVAPVVSGAVCAGGTAVATGASVADTPAIGGVPSPAPWLLDLERESRSLLQAGAPEVWDTLTRKFEAQLIHTALEVTRGRRIEAAQKLGIGRNTITRKIQELGLDD